MNAPELISFAPDDQQAVEAFFREAWRASRFPFDPAGAHADLRRIPAEYQSNGGGFWTLRADGRIIGTLAVRRLPGNVSEVKRLNLLAPYRGRGFGERLFRKALDHAAGSGFAAVRLDTLRNPGPALAMFRKFGFVEIPRYNDNPHAELFMELDLRRTSGGHIAPAGEGPAA